ncbi:MAG: hypothetical protein K6E59_02325 [Bacilli bacterium]|nr:hypothetical protein [Bacilli bacterium]
MTISRGDLLREYKFKGPLRYERVDYPLAYVTLSFYSDRFVYKAWTKEKTIAFFCVSYGLLNGTANVTEGLQVCHSDSFIKAAPDYFSLVALPSDILDGEERLAIIGETLREMAMRFEKAKDYKHFCQILDHAEDWDKRLYFFENLHLFEVYRPMYDEYRPTATLFNKGYGNVDVCNEVLISIRREAWDFPNTPIGTPIVPSFAGCIKGNTMPFRCIKYVLYFDNESTLKKFASQANPKGLEGSGWQNLKEIKGVNFPMMIVFLTSRASYEVVAFDVSTLDEHWEQVLSKFGQDYSYAEYAEKHPDQKELEDPHHYDCPVKIQNN